MKSRANCTSSAASRRSLLACLARALARRRRARLPLTPVNNCSMIARAVATASPGRGATTVAPTSSRARSRGVPPTLRSSVTTGRHGRSVTALLLLPRPAATRCPPQRRLNDARQGRDLTD